MIDSRGKCPQNFSWILSGKVKDRAISANEPRDPGMPKMVQKEQTHLLLEQITSNTNA